MYAERREHELTKLLGNCLLGLVFHRGNLQERDLQAMEFLADKHLKELDQNHPGWRERLPDTRSKK